MTPPFVKGDRIMLLVMPDDPSPIEAGATGTVQACVELPFTEQGKDQWQVWVRWDNGRGLSLVMPPDQAMKLSEGT